MSAIAVQYRFGYAYLQCGDCKLVLSLDEATSDRKFFEHVCEKPAGRLFWERKSEVTK